MTNNKIDVKPSQHTISRGNRTHFAMNESHYFLRTGVINTVSNFSRSVDSQSGSHQESLIETQPIDTGDMRGE